MPDANQQQKSIVLILARELASKLATAVFIVNPEGTLIFYNEQAEEILGQPFAQAGELTAEEWAPRWSPEEMDGTPIPLQNLPLGVAMAEHRPGHLSFRITGSDGVKRVIAVTAFPLFAHEQKFVGAVAIFWEELEPEVG